MRRGLLQVFRLMKILSQATVHLGRQCLDVHEMIEAVARREGSNAEAIQIAATPQEGLTRGLCSVPARALVHRLAVLDALRIEARNQLCEWM